VAIISARRSGGNASKKVGSIPSGHDSLPTAPLGSWEALAPSPSPASPSALPPSSLSLTPPAKSSAAARSSMSCSPSSRLWTEGAYTVLPPAVAATESPPSLIITSGSSPPALSTISGILSACSADPSALPTSRGASCVAGAVFEVPPGALVFCVSKGGSAGPCTAAAACGSSVTPAGGRGLESPGLGDVSCIYCTKATSTAAENSRPLTVP